MPLRAIVAVDTNWAIGCGGRLLVNVPKDMQFFRKNTINKTILCGRKTLASFPDGKPLPKRENWVLSRTLRPTADMRVFRTVEEVLAAVREDPTREVWVVGGEEIYRLFVPYCDEVYVTQLEYTAPQADAWFPRLDQDPAWEGRDHSRIWDDKAGFGFVVRVYRPLREAEEQ